MVGKRKIRYAVVGTGGRAQGFIRDLVTTYTNEGELVGLADTNNGRLEYHNKVITEELGHHKIAAYHSDNFDLMVEETNPDVVIVTTIDAAHHKYIIRAMELGCDAITEKPMTIDEVKCNAITDAIKRTGKKLRVLFNYRWAPANTKVREILESGTIGEILHVDMEYWLNTSHGADYFRRWHREKNNSGGLIVHKATHHFDLVNWWIDAIPKTVYGTGRLAFYGRKNAESRGEKVHYERYTGYETSKDPFAINLKENKKMRDLYFNNERYDGYIRDKNVFGDGITIEDSMSLVVKYRTGAVLSYSLNAYLPREGFRVAFNGTKGRVEYEENRSINGVDNKTPNDLIWRPQLVVYPLFSEPYEVDVPTLEGGHGGGDELLKHQVFAQDAGPDPLNRDAGHQQGAASVLIGAAANKSFGKDQVVSIDEISSCLGNARRLSEVT